MNKWEYANAAGMRGHGGESYSFSGKDFPMPWICWIMPETMDGN